MTASDTLITSTTPYPVFASKAAFLTALEQAVEQENNKAAFREVLYRLSNTDTSTWADPTVRHDA